MTPRDLAAAAVERCLRLKHLKIKSGFIVIDNLKAACPRCIESAAQEQAKPERQGSPQEVLGRLEPVEGEQGQAFMDALAEPEPLSTVERRRGLAAKILCVGCANGYELYDDEREGYPCHRTGTVIVEVFGCTGMAEAEEEDMQRAVALIAAYEREQAGEGWQPIETAPRQAGNGWNRFVVCKAGAGPRFVQIVDGFANLEAFTHWMPLPSPPTEEKGR
jgi:hypothetical protein